MHVYYDYTLGFSSVPVLLSNIFAIPTGSIKVEHSPPEREVVSLIHSRVIPKT